MKIKAYLAERRFLWWRIALVVLIVAILIPFMNRLTQPNFEPINLLTGEWGYIPFVLREDNALRVQTSTLVLVEQDGSVSQSNPPINMYGTYASKVDADFAVRSQIELDTARYASLQLYARLPIFADEFRVERESIRFDITSDQLTVSVWNGSSQQPSVSGTYPFESSKSITFEYRHTGKSGRIEVNGQKLTTLKDIGFFESSQLWFGVDATEGNWLLQGLEIEQLSRGSLTIANSAQTSPQVTTVGLQSLANQSRSDFTVGGTVALGPAVSDVEYAAIAFDTGKFGSVTLENEMKMLHLQPVQGVFTFQKADALVAIAEQNNQKIHGHALVFGEVVPPWLLNLSQSTSEGKEEVKKVMQDHIRAVMTHFGEKIASWDVINEPLADNDDFNPAQTKIWREHVWYKAMGPTYIIDALELAYQTNPQALLFINEFGLENPGLRWDAFLAEIKKLKMQLQSRNIPVDTVAVGFQAHVYEPNDRIDPVSLRNHIKELAALGFKSQVSEMDVYGWDGEDIQATQYAEIFGVCVTEPSCVSWRTWMITDRYNVWMNDGTIQYGVDGLFDSNMQPRAAVQKMQDVLLLK